MHFLTVWLLFFVSLEVLGDGLQRMDNSSRSSLPNVGWQSCVLVVRFKNQQGRRRAVEATASHRSLIDAVLPQIAGHCPAARRVTLFVLLFDQPVTHLLVPLFPIFAAELEQDLICEVVVVEAVRPAGPLQVSRKHFQSGLFAPHAPWTTTQRWKQVKRLLSFSS